MLSAVSAHKLRFMMLVIGKSCSELHLRHLTPETIVRVDTTDGTRWFLEQVPESNSRVNVLQVRGPSARSLRQSSYIGLSAAPTLRIGDPVRLSESFSIRRRPAV